MEASFFQAPPVAFVGKGLAAADAESSEDAPAADEAGLAGRKADFLDGQEAFVVKDVGVNHVESFDLSTRPILAEKSARLPLRLPSRPLVCNCHARFCHAEHQLGFAQKVDLLWAQEKEGGRCSGRPRKRERKPAG